MGNCVGGFKKYTKRRKPIFSLFRKRKVCLCIIGMDGVGKSSVSKALASEDVNEVLPTNGFTLCEFDYKRVHIVFYDLGGDERIRAIWTNYYAEVYGLIYVVDGTDSDRLGENREILESVLGNADLSDKPMLLLINKSDRQGCVDEIQLSDRLALHDLADRHSAQIRVEVCSAIQGSGKAIDKSITDGFDWLLDKIFENYRSLTKRVNEALEQLKQKQLEDRQNRQQRQPKTFETATVDEKLQFSEQLATCGKKKQEELRMQNSSERGNLGKKLAERSNFFHKLAKTQVVPLEEIEDPGSSRPANESNAVQQRIPVPSVLPPLKHPRIEKGVSNGGLQVSAKKAQAGKKRRRKENQVIPLVVLQAPDASTSSAAT